MYVLLLLSLKILFSILSENLDCIVAELLLVDSPWQTSWKILGSGGLASSGEPPCVNVADLLILELQEILLLPLQLFFLPLLLLMSLLLVLPLSDLLFYYHLHSLLLHRFLYLLRYHHYFTFLQLFLLILLLFSWQSLSFLYSPLTLYYRLLLPLYWILLMRRFCTSFFIHQ